MCTYCTLSVYLVLPVLLYTPVRHGQYWLPTQNVWKLFTWSVNAKISKICMLARPCQKLRSFSIDRSSSRVGSRHYYAAGILSLTTLPDSPSLRRHASSPRASVTYPHVTRSPPWTGLELEALLRPSHVTDGSTSSAGTTTTTLHRADLWTVEKIYQAWSFGGDAIVCPRRLCANDNDLDYSSFCVFASLVRNNI